MEKQKGIKMIKKAKVYQIQTEGTVEPQTDNLSGVALLKYLFSDFFRISCVILFIYIDGIFLAYPFTFLSQYGKIGTIFGVFENYSLPGSYIYIPAALFFEVIIIIFEYKLFRRLWPKRTKLM